MLEVQIHFPNFKEKPDFLPQTLADPLHCGNQLLPGHIPDAKEKHDKKLIFKITKITKHDGKLIPDSEEKSDGK